MRDLHHFQPLVAVDLKRRNFLSNAVHQNFTATARDRSESCALESRDHFSQRHPESFGKMLEFRRTESVDIDVRILVPDVLEEIEIPRERQLRMMPALHQDLHSSDRRQLVKFLVDLFERQNIMVRVPLSSVKCAKLAVNIANIGVVDVSIDNVSHHLIAFSVIRRALCLLSSLVSKRSQLFHRQTMKLKRVFSRYSFAGENSVRQGIAI